HWKHLPVALYEEGDEMIFSGGAVVDWENTSGFGDGSSPPLVPVYTSAYMGDDPNQAQSLAYSLDEGKTFTKYEDNPVLDHADPDFRDPNVMWHEPSEQWIMVVSLPRQYKVQFYSSDDLIDWEHLSDFGPSGATGGIWECPDFFELAVNGDPNNKRWVLHVDINPGSVAGGSGSQYFVGDFDGTHFIEDETVSNGEVLWVDYGPDFYAAISWNNIPDNDGRRLWLGWMSNWAYAEETPTSPWRSAMSIPRSVELQTIDGNIRLVQQPVRELQQLRDSHVQLENFTLEKGSTTLSSEGISGDTFELIADLEIGNSEVTGFKVRVGEDEETLIGYDATSETVFIDRTNSGEDDFHEDFATRSDAPVALDNGRVRLHVFVDWSSVEVFANDGAAVLTSRIFPDPESQEVMLFTDGDNAKITNLDAWTLNSIWPEPSSGFIYNPASAHEDPQKHPQ
ncbi:MAG: glycoside hydrolase family 32 protein, partial [Balneolales bacterium]